MRMFHSKREEILDDLIARVPVKVITHKFKISEYMVRYFKNTYLTISLQRKNYRDGRQLELDL